MPAFALDLGAFSGLNGRGGFELQSDGSDRPDDVLQLRLRGASRTQALRRPGDRALIWLFPYPIAT